MVGLAIVRVTEAASTAMRGRGGGEEEEEKDDCDDRLWFKLAARHA
jgi:hypothetical protein